MYSGRFLRIKYASEETGKTILELIEMGFHDNLNIYAWGRWFCFEMETPFKRRSVDSPIWMNDKKHLACLCNGKTIDLFIDADGRFICEPDSRDDNYLDGVKINQADLYCLKSDIEALSFNTPPIKTKKQPGDGKASVYLRREKSFDDWVTKSDIDLNSLKVETIFDQVKLTNKELWNITFITFKRDFWQNYSSINNLGKQPGRPNRK